MLCFIVDKVVYYSIVGYRLLATFGKRVEVQVQSLTL